jgi:hypothetical protein
MDDAIVDFEWENAMLLGKTGGQSAKGFRRYGWPGGGVKIRCVRIAHAQIISRFMVAESFIINLQVPAPNKPFKDVTPLVKT